MFKTKSKLVSDMMSTMSSNSLTSNDERIGDSSIVKKLSNLLKLPKAQRWICCEFFYSDIDRVIFDSENDFASCIKQSFPHLKTNKLRRKQWRILRSLIGKPRRCSDSFFQEERNMLEEKRQKIRLIQQRKISEKDHQLFDFKDLPQEIPLTLSIGHKVYAHICHKEAAGVFSGTIRAIDPCEHTYRVVFDRGAIGSQTVYDFEIKSIAPIQTIPIKAYIQTYRPPKLNQAQAQIAGNSLSNQHLTPNLSTSFNNTTPLFLNNIIPANTPGTNVTSNILTPNQGTGIINNNSNNKLLIKNGLELISSNITNMGQVLYGSCIGAGNANSINNLLIDDLNTLNATNQNFANALLFQSSGVDPMLTSITGNLVSTNTQACNNPNNNSENYVSCNKLINDSTSPTTILNILNTFNGGAISTQSVSEETLNVNAHPEENESKHSDNNNNNSNMNVTTTGIGLLGGFPIHLLLMITRLNKILSIKREQIKKLNELNTEAERVKASQASFESNNMITDQNNSTPVFTKEFQMTYALLVLDLERLNKDLNDYLIGVQRWCETFSPNFKFINNNTNNNIHNDTSVNKSFKLNNADFNSTNLKVHYLNKSIELVNTFNKTKLINQEKNEDNSNQIEENMNRIDLNSDINEQNENKSSKKALIESKPTVDLITKLTSLLLQIRDYTNSTATSASLPYFNKSKNNQREGNSNLGYRNVENASQNDDTNEDEDETEKKNTRMTAFLPFCSQTLNESIEDIKKNLLNKNNVKLFEEKIQIHLSHIQSLYHFNKLHAFKYSSPIENDLKEKNQMNEISEDKKRKGEDNTEINVQFETSNNDFNNYNMSIIKPQLI